MKLWKAEGNRMALILSFRDLRVYKMAMAAANDIFILSKRFPPEEKYSLTDQIRRSSRSVPANVAEAWRKRRYPLAFVAKLSDADGESAETQSWLDIALSCGYITREQHADMDAKYHHICAQLCLMMGNPEKWCVQVRR